MIIHLDLGSDPAFVFPFIISGSFKERPGMTKMPKRPRCRVAFLLLLFACLLVLSLLSSSFSCCSRVCSFFLFCRLRSLVVRVFARSFSSVVFVLLLLLRSCNRFSFSSSSSFPSSSLFVSRFFFPIVLLLVFLCFVLSRSERLCRDPTSFQYLLVLVRWFLPVTYFFYFFLKERPALTKMPNGPSVCRILESDCPSFSLFSILLPDLITSLPKPNVSSCSLCSTVCDSVDCDYSVRLHRLLLSCSAFCSLSHFSNALSYSLISLVLFFLSR
jgi:hypothetical protein